VPARQAERPVHAQDDAAAPRRNKTGHPSRVARRRRCAKPEWP
jgi:hypothetical protein